MREGSSGLDQIVEFVKDDETDEWSVVTNVSVCPEMAYLPEKVAAFGEHGIVRQIYDSLAQVRNAVESRDLTHVQGLYWIREVATTWLYLVGDDTGSVSSDSNNNGLGYVVTPKGEESGYIDSFTEQARALIANGGGSFERTKGEGATEGNFYVFGDNFIGAENAVDASSAYAGVFILVASAVPYDTNGWGSYTVVYDEETDSYSEEEKLDFGGLEEGVLPMDYVLTHAARRRSRGCRDRPRVHRGSAALRQAHRDLREEGQHLRHRVLRHHRVQRKGLQVPLEGPRLRSFRTIRDPG